MKKWICLVLVISMMCYVSACGKEEQGDGNMTEITSTETDQHDYLAENESTAGAKQNFPMMVFSQSMNLMGLALEPCLDEWSGHTIQIQFHGMEMGTGGRQTILMKLLSSKW